MFTLRAVDLNLLPVFEAAYEERNLSRAAERLAMTQSAVSHALSRLRTLFRDQLFIRGARGMTPTPAADRVYEQLRPALNAVRDVVVETRGFDPRTSRRRFFVAVPHPLGPMIAIRLRTQLARVAPGVTIEFSTQSRPADLARGLREGRVDLAVDWLAPGGDEFLEERLFDDMIVAVARAGHPALRKRGAVRDLKDLEFVSLRQRADMPGVPLGVLQWRQAGLNVVLEVSEIIETLMVVSQSDLCGIIPRSLAKAARELLDVRVLPASLQSVPIPIKLIWHASRDADQAHAFVRRQLAIAATAAA